MTREVEWARLRADELRALAADDALVVLPVAAIEQHGPHLPSMTDTRLAHEVTLRAARAASRGAVVTPVVWSGLSEHHVPFGGTLTLTPATFQAVLADLVEAMTRQGFSRFLIVNAHGGNAVAVRAAADAIAMKTGAIVVATTYFAEAGPAIAPLLTTQDRVGHACEAETAMMLAVEPDLVKRDAIKDTGAPQRPSVEVGVAAHRWRPFTSLTENGVLGNPAPSTAEQGQKLLAATAAAITALIDDVAIWAP